MPTPLEYVLLNTYKDEMNRYLVRHPEFFQEALALALSDRQPLAWRAAWILNHGMESNDPRIRPVVGTMIDLLSKRPDGHIRSLLQILQAMDIPENLEGKLFDLCADIWEMVQKQPSVRLNAFKIMLQITQKHPELKGELHLYLQEHYLETLSPGVRHSIQKMNSQL